MCNMKLVLFAILSYYCSAFGFKFEDQTTNIFVEQTLGGHLATDKALSEKFDEFTRVAQQSQDRRKMETKFLTTPLLPDDLTLEDNLNNNNIPDHGAAWNSENTEYVKNNVTIQDDTVSHPEIKEEETEMTGLIHTESLLTTDTNLEGSGDLSSDVFETSFSTNTKSDITTSFTPSVTPITGAGDSNKTSILEYCFTTACNFEEIKVDSKTKIIVPVSSNISVLCSSLSNDTYSDHLHWYFVNGTEATHKHKSNHNVSLELYNTEIWDSGIYKCVKIKQNFCCHSELYITIYEIPNYKLHIIIAGSVALLCFIICVILTIVRTIRMKKYSALEKSRQEQSESLMVL